MNNIKSDSKLFTDMHTNVFLLTVPVTIPEFLNHAGDETQVLGYHPGILFINLMSIQQDNDILTFN